LARPDGSTDVRKFLPIALLLRFLVDLAKLVDGRDALRRFLRRLPGLRRVSLLDVVETPLGGAAQMMPEVADAVGSFDEDSETQDALVDRLAAGLAFRAARPSALDNVRRLGFRARGLREGGFFSHLASILLSQRTGTTG
jgi:hypothetical protein